MIRLLVAMIVIGLGLVIGCTRSAKNADQGHARDHGADHAQHDQPAADQLIVSTSPAQPKAGEPVKIELMVHTSSGEMLQSFETNHEKLAHLIVVRDGLDEFAHLHPDVGSDGRITTTYTFPQGGTYRVFLDYKPTGGTQATAQASVSVEGNAKPAPELKPTVPGVVTVEGLQANVTVKSRENSPERILQFSLKDDDGNPIHNLEPYLGAMGHLVVLSADGRRYVHAHPLKKSEEPNVVAFDVHFPADGLYKAWGQFQREGSVLTIPVVLRIN
jgi:hypothetical protein